MTIKQLATKILSELTEDAGYRVPLRHLIARHGKHTVAALDLLGKQVVRSSGVGAWVAVF